MEIKTIKGIKPDIWAKFKAMAARKDTSMGELFGIMVNDFEKRNDVAWDNILNSKKILSDSEAESMLKDIKKLRKERGFRWD